MCEFVTFPSTHAVLKLTNVKLRPTIQKLPYKEHFQKSEFFGFSILMLMFKEIANFTKVNIAI